MRHHPIEFQHMPRMCKDQKGLKHITSGNNSSQTSTMLTSMLTLEGKALSPAVVNLPCNNKQDFDSHNQQNSVAILSLEIIILLIAAMT